MEKFKLVIVLIWSIVWLICCSSNPRRNCVTTQRVKKNTGEGIAVDYLIQKYEREHQKFYKEEIKDGDHMKWTDLNNKNLSVYCRKFLEHSIPRRIKNEDVIGTKFRRELHYNNENTNCPSIVVIIHCKLMKNSPLSYYITRAPEPHCVYAVTCTYYGAVNKFTIIHKYCTFEEKSVKRKRTEISGKVHASTGQPIAEDKYLLEYELEHQELLKRKGSKGKRIEWPHVMQHDNLDSYCYQYMEECVPGRNRHGTIGSWNIEKLSYWKLKIEEFFEVTTVACRPHKTSSRRYYMTRAIETNCVYALIRKFQNAYSPLVIVFKHCDFENLNYQQNISHNYNSLDKTKIPKTEMKEEIIDKQDILQLFPEY